MLQIDKSYNQSVYKCNISIHLRLQIFNLKMTYSSHEIRQKSEFTTSRP